MGATTKTLYETDFVAWAERTAGLVRERRLEDVDLEHVAEELEGLAGADRRAVRSHWLRLIKHLVKQRLQPERSVASWRESIVSARSEILNYLEDSPSLRGHLEERRQSIYQRAVKDALAEIRQPPSRAAELPAECPWALDELLEGEPE